VLIRMLPDKLLGATRRPFVRRRLERMATFPISTPCLTEAVARHSE
jgi:hypothetical protein